MNPQYYAEKFLGRLVKAEHISQSSDYIPAETPLAHLHHAMNHSRKAEKLNREQGQSTEERKHRRYALAHERRATVGIKIRNKKNR